MKRTAVTVGMTIEEIDSEKSRVAEIRFAMMRLFPFFGHLLANIPMAFSYVGTACATNEGPVGSIYLDPRFTRGLRRGQLMSVVFHELWHIAGGAFSRQRHREDNGWNKAHDHATNLVIRMVRDANPNLGIEFWEDPPPLMDDAYVGLTGESIYDLVMQPESQASSSDLGGASEEEEGNQGPEGESEPEGESDQAPEGGDREGEGDSAADRKGEAGSPTDESDDNDSGPGGAPSDGAGGEDGDPGFRDGGPAGSPKIAPRNGGHGVGDATDLVRVPRPGMNRDQERAADRAQEQAVRNLLAAAIEFQAIRKAGTMPGGLVEIVNSVIRPPVPWVDEFLHLASGSIRGGTVTYAHPSKRSAAFEDDGEGLILPGEGRRLPRIAIITDSSRSVSTVELQEFVPVMRQFIETLEAGIRWIQVDSMIQSDDEIDDFDMAFGASIPFYGRGGTVFDGLPDRLSDPAFESVDLAIIFTDGEPVRWPEYDAWPCPVVVVTVRTMPPKPYPAVLLEVAR